jgi:hypothetical protein
MLKPRENNNTQQKKKERRENNINKSPNSKISSTSARGRPGV